jgi:hypothetical protein
MDVLAKTFAEAGLATALCGPGNLRWRADHIPELDHAGGRRAVAGLFRFYPCTWIAKLARRERAGWLGCPLPCANPLRALRAQDKRAPLRWRRLGLAMPAWNAVVPEHRCPSQAVADPDGWVLKPAWGWEGTGVSLADGDPAHRRRLARARWWPWPWVLQRRFASLPLASPWGPRHVTVGVFTVDGRAAGVFGRAAAKALIDHRAMHAAVLVEDEP